MHSWCLSVPINRKRAFLSIILVSHIIVTLAWSDESQQESVRNEALSLKNIRLLIQDRTLLISTELGWQRSDMKQYSRPNTATTKQFWVFYKNFLGVFCLICTNRQLFVNARLLSCPGEFCWRERIWGNCLKMFTLGAKTVFLHLMYTVKRWMRNGASLTRDSNI